MKPFTWRERFLAGIVILAWALSHAGVCGGQTERPAPTPAEKVRKALDQPITLDYSGQSLSEAVQHLRDKTGLDIALDIQTLQMMGLLIEEMPTPVHLKSERGKLRHALQRLLNGFNLSYVVLEDGLFISTEDVGLQRQLRQRVSVQVKDEPLAKALAHLSRRYGVNLFIDPRVAAKAQQNMTLELEDATVETAVRLLAELNDLKAVRVGNVLFVTNEERAQKMRQEEASAPDSRGQFMPLRFGGAAGGIALPVNVK